METIIKPKIDSNKYKYIKLKNGIKVVLIEKDVVQTSISVNIGTGFLEDPKHMQGLAHYLEHMLFMGSKKYPNTNHFGNFITKNGGFRNAYTGLENTTYVLQINNKHFKEALDIFSQFFIEPLFSPECLEKEVNAVNSEFIMYNSDDFRKYLELHKVILDDKEKFKNFGCGNIKTLTEHFNKDGKINYLKMREELIKFYNTYYVSENMSICIISKMTLIEQQKIIEDIFLKIPKKEIKVIQNYHNPFKNINDNKIKNIFNVEKVVDEDDILFIWNLDTTPFEKMYNFNLGDFLNYLLNIKLKNGLLHTLLEQKLIKSMSSHSIFLVQNFYFFNLFVNITKKGKNNIRTIYNAIISFFNKFYSLDDDTIFKYFKQFVEIQEIQFNYSELGDDLDLINNISTHLAYKNVKYCIGGNIVDLKKKLIKLKNLIIHSIRDLIKNLNPSKLQLFIRSKQFNFKKFKVEPYYNTKYVLDENKQLDFLVGENKKFNIELPKLNKYIPNDFNVYKQKTSNIDYCENKNYEIWSRKTIFDEPKIFIQSNFFYNINSPIEQYLITLYLKTKMMMINFKLGNYFSIGNDISIKSINMNSNYFSINYYGFSQYSYNIFNKAINELFSSELDELFFEISKKKIISDIKNIKFDTLFKILLNEFNIESEVNVLNPEDYLDQIKSISFQQCKSFFNKIKNNFYCKIYLNGNINDTLINKIKIPSFKNKLSNQVLDKLLSKIYINDDCKKIILKNNKIKQSSEVSVGYFYPVKYLNPISNFNEFAKYFIKNIILDSLLSDSFFNEIRTKRQIGYVAGNKPTKIGKYDDVKLFQVFYTMSGVKDVKYIQTSFDEYFKNIKSFIKLSDLPNIKKNIQEMIEEKKLNNLDYYDEDTNIIFNYFPPNYKQTFLDHSKNITENEMKEFINNVFKQTPIKIIFNKNNE